MDGRLILAAALLFAVAACSDRKDKEADAPPPAAPPSIAFEDYADDWLAFDDATADLPVGERMAAFRREVAAKFPAYYVDRWENEDEKARFDERLKASIESFAEIREGFVSKHQAFAASLAGNVAAFREAFPDYGAATRIALVHSLGEMDGGTRTLGGEEWLIFGVDGMVRYHEPTSDERPFFTHELFHTYHLPRLGACDVMWCALWTEGLAVYVAHSLYPQANEDELLLSHPKNLPAMVEAKLPEAAADMLASFDSEDGEKYQALFQFRDDGSGLPRRRGYYLGYLVARALGDSFTPQELASMDAETAEPHVRRALEAIAANAKAG